MGVSKVKGLLVSNLNYYNLKIFIYVIFKKTLLRHF